MIRDLQLSAPNGPYSPVRASSLLQTVVLNQAVMMAVNHVDIFTLTVFAPLLHQVAHFAHTLHPAGQLVPRFEEALWGTTNAHAGWRAGENYITGQQGRYL